MPQYFKILLAAAVAIFVAYAGFMSLILTGASSTKALTLGVLGYVAWVAIVVAAQAAVTPGPEALGCFTPNQPEALVAYLISIVTSATLARLTYALWQERRA